MISSSSSNKNKNYDVIILGGGAAGLMCALTAGQQGKRVLVLEVSNKIGKKILMSGGGRCNFTNMDVTADNFLSQNPHFCKSALKQYTHWDFIAMVAKHVIEYEERKHQQLFCVDSSKDILNMLKAECEAAKVSIWQKAVTDSVKFEEGTGEAVLTLDHDGVTKVVAAPSLVVATGGLSIPTLGGATGFAYQLAEQLELNLIPRTAGLVPFTLSGNLLDLSNALVGVSLPINVSCQITSGVSGSNNKKQQSFYEDMLFTHRGISGPSILQISSYWQLGSEIEIDLLPTIDKDELLETFLSTKLSNPKSQAKSLLNKFFPKAVAAAFAKQFGGDKQETPLHEWQKTELEALANTLKAWGFKPSGTEGYRTAEVTLGGVDTNAVSSKTMQLKSTEGEGFANVFFIGEALDVTGHLGGYNFQWAWSSGYVAGINV